MKKYLIGLLTIVLCLTLVGCGDKKEENKEDEKVVGGWEISLMDSNDFINEEEKNIFTEAVKGSKEKLELIDTLATQVVAGKNYMFLAKTDKEYKIVVVYKDLQGNVKLTSSKTFDYNKYVGESSKGKDEQLAGGWNVEIPGKVRMLDEKVQAAFDKVTEKEDINYAPIGLVASQVVAGKNYAVLAYGKGTVNGIYLLTIYDGVDGTKELTSSAYINLGEYNN